MPQEPFTNAGVAAKLTDLYALPDADLSIEAEAVANDFGTWMGTNFILDAYQQGYIDDAPSMTKMFWGHLFAAAFLTRSPIDVDTPMPNPQPRRTKELRKNVDGVLQYNDDTKVLTGSLEINITWDLL